MPVNFSNTKPIFLQLADIIKSDIISKKYQVNEKLPSVRELAFQYSINPNTVQKALQLLEEDGLIITDSTNGKFVSSNITQLEVHKTKTINNEVKKFIENMQSFGLNLNEIKNIINNVGD